MQKIRLRRSGILPLPYPPPIPPPLTYCVSQEAAAIVNSDLFAISLLIWCACVVNSRSKIQVSIDIIRSLLCICIILSCHSYTAFTTSYRLDICDFAARLARATYARISQINRKMTYHCIIMSHSFL